MCMALLAVARATMVVITLAASGMAMAGAAGLDLGLFLPFWRLLPLPLELLRGRPPFDDPGLFDCDLEADR